MVQASDYFCFWKVPLDLHSLSQTDTNQQTSGVELPVLFAPAHPLSTRTPSAMIPAADQQI